MTKKKLTYDVHFDTDTDSLSKGFKASKKYCLQYIQDNQERIKKDYNGYCPSVVCNETGDRFYLLIL